MKALESAIEAVDQHIRAGKTAKARRLLSESTTKRPPREFLTRLSSLAWRCDLPLLGLKLLNPIVRPSERSRLKDPSPIERMEYAACLIKIGASEEGLSLLKNIDGNAHPKSLLYQVFARASRWDYAPTVTVLNQYTDLMKSDPYQVLVGKVNLVYALIFLGNYIEADQIIEEIYSNAKEKSLSLVLGKALELSCQSLFFQNKTSEAKKRIAQARELLSEDSLDAFFIRKWDKAMELSSRPRSLEPIRKEALSRRHWETLRDCDRLEAIFAKNSKKLWKLYFGTPYPGYKARLLELAGPQKNFPTEFTWEIESGSSALDVSLREGRLGKHFLSQGKLLHKMLSELVADFYRPIRLASLFHRLHPDEFFHPVASPSRIYDLMKRFRQELRKSKLPLSLWEKNGEYQLVASGPCSIQVSEEPISRTLSRIDELKNQFGKDSFSVSELAKCLKLPLRSAQRFCQESTESGELLRQGSGRGTRYLIAS